MNAHSTSWKVACFDLDGTLVSGGTSTCQYLRELLGYGHHTAEFDSKYASGMMTASEIAHAECIFYRGLTAQDIERMLASIPLIDGISDTVDHLRKRGITVLLTTISWSFISRVIATRFGFDEYTGYGMDHLPDGTLSGKLEREFDEFRKRDFVVEYCLARGIAMNEVFAVGDSRSDLPLFSAVGYSVAINASAEATAVASRSVQTRDLRDILSIVPGLWP